MHTNPEVLALLALGEDVGNPAEREHAHSCPACAEEVAELARIADVGRLSTSADSLSAPSPEVWRRITTELGFDVRSDLLAQPAPGPSEPRLTPRATVTELSGHRNGARPAEPAVVDGGGRGGRRWLSLAVAAGLALVAGVGIGVVYEKNVLEPRTRVIASADLQPLPAFPGAKGTAEVTADGRGKRELIVKMASQAPVAGKVEVWLIDGEGTPTSMGVMSDGEARIVIPPGMSLFQRPLVDVSDEPANDTDPKHSGKSIVRGELA